MFAHDLLSHLVTALTKLHPQVGRLVISELYSPTTVAAKPYTIQMFLSSATRQYWIIAFVIRRPTIDKAVLCILILALHHQSKAQYF